MGARGGGPRTAVSRVWFCLVGLLGAGCGVARDEVDLLARRDDGAFHADSIDLEFLAPRLEWHRSGWLTPGESAQASALWMRKLEASIDVPFFSTVAKELVLRVRCHPRLAPGLSVALSLNGSPLGDFTALPAFSDVRLTLPTRTQRPGGNRLTFSAPHRYVPGPGDPDGRPLAIEVRSLEIHPSGGDGKDVPRIAAGHSLRLPRNASVGFAFRPKDGSRIRFEIAETAGQPTRVEVGLASDERRVALDDGPLSSGGRKRRRLALPGRVGDIAELTLANLGPGTLEIRELRLDLPRPPARPAAARLPGTPNVVLFLVDTLRADDLGAYGSGLPTSPELDRFAAEGIRFQHATAQSAWTRPTVASLFTGLHAGTHGMSDLSETLVPEITTLAESLRERGYATAAVVANRVVLPDRGFGQGFAAWNPGAGDALYDAPSDVLVRQALDWVDAGREPFFLYVHTLDPHDPYEPPKPFGSPFEVEGYAGERDSRKLVAKVKLGADELRYLRSKYRGEILQNDAAFGALVSGLRSRDMLDRSVVIFTSDHGEEFLEHGGLLHRRTLYEEILRVPLAVRLPAGRGGGTVIEAPIRQVDVFPTVAALVGAEAPADVEGTDHSRAWQAGGAAAPASEPMAEVVDEKVRKFTVRSGDLKLVVNDDARGYWRAGDPVELYDLRADPAERRNVVDERPIAARYLGTLLGRLQAEQQARRRRWASDSRRPLSSQEREHLRALGYVE